MIITRIFNNLKTNYLKIKFSPRENLTKKFLHNENLTKKFSKENLTKKFSKENFLPSNYSKKHIHFLKWNFISTITGSANSALSTTCILSSLMPSNNSFIIAYNYIGRDIIGQLGGLLFVSKHAVKMDKDAYTYGLKSNKVMQISTIMEISGSFLPTYLLLPCFGLANVGKNISWIGIGSINAKCLMILSKMSRIDSTKETNISEMYAKVTVINTLASTIGLSLGIVLSKLNVIIPFSSIIIAPILSGISYYSYKKAIQPLLKIEHKVYTDNEIVEKINDDVC
jgi:hypothetical protein